MSKKVEDVLTHYGVLGMHWGKRKGESSSDISASAKRYVSSEIKNTKQASVEIHGITQDLKGSLDVIPWLKEHHSPEYNRTFVKNCKNNTKYFMAVEKEVLTKYPELRKDPIVMAAHAENKKIVSELAIQLEELIHGIIDDTLTHYGILGMHWGRRRIGIAPERQAAYDKADIEALKSGKRHMSIGFTKKRQAEYDKRDIARLEKHVKAHEDRKAATEAKKAEAAAKKSPDHNKKVDLKKKPVSEMSNAELKSLNERLQLEKQYRDLSKNDLSPGKKFARDLLVDVGKELVKETLKSSAKSKLLKVLK